jgi:hypothetical protein
MRADYVQFCDGVDGSGGVVGCARPDAGRATDRISAAEETISLCYSLI